MKHLLGTSLAILLAVSFSFSQAPQSFKYQAIVRDAEGNILPNKNINLRISIVSGQSDVILVYAETHIVQTSPFGLINIEIGNGKVESGDFSAIDWSKGNYNVNIEIDENGGTEYVSMGSSQLLSVPYALYAEQSGSESESGTKEADSWTEGTGVTYLTNPNNVGVGTKAPASKLHVTGTGINAIYERNISTAAGPANRFYKSRGSESSKTQIQAGDNMGQFQFWGMGDDGAYDIGATLKGVAESTRTGTDIFDVAASIQFLTTNTAYSWGERMRITADGNVGIGTTAPAGILDIAGAYHFPSVDGLNGEVLRTDGSGTLTWGSGGAQEIDDLTDGSSDGSSVFLGAGAGTNDDGTSNKNVGVGIDALNSNTSGSYNTATGYSALQANTIGCFNTATGRYALQDNTEGNDNTAFGNYSLKNNTTGYYNTAAGDCALAFNTIGNYNTAIGKSANWYNQAGSCNTILGCEAGKGASLHSKSGNIFIGYKAGFYETHDNRLYIENSDSNTPLLYGEFDNDLLRVNGTLQINDEYSFPLTDGLNGQFLVTDGSGSLGWTSDVGADEINDLLDGKTGGFSTFLGSGSGALDNGFDNYNVGVGFSSLNSNTSGMFNTAVGTWALSANTTGFSNTAVGYLSQASTTTAMSNTSVGNNSLYTNTTGGNNTALGDGALYFNNADYNTAVGAAALYDNTSGERNTAVGYYALTFNTTAIGNVANGYYALRGNTTGNNNTATGAYALESNVDGVSNTAVGQNALKENTSGDCNVAIGASAGQLNTTANSNILIGFNANYYNQTGSNNVIIGRAAGQGSSPHSKSGCVFIGYQAGFNETGSNKLYIDNSGTSEPLIYGDFSTDMLRVNGALHVRDQYQFPTTDGAAGQVLQTNGSGVLSWSNSVMPSGALGKTFYHNGNSWATTYNLYNDGTYVGVGTTSPSHLLEVRKAGNGEFLSLFENTSLGLGSTALKAKSVYDTYGYLGVEGLDNYDGNSDIDIGGDEIGVLGVSIGTSTADNYGVYGASNGIAVYGQNVSSNREGYLAGDQYGAYGQYSSDQYGYLGGDSYGAYGQYSSDQYGYLGGDSYGSYGQYNANVYGALGTATYGVYGRYGTKVHGGIALNGNVGLYTFVSNVGSTSKGAHIWITNTSGITFGALLQADYTGATAPGSSHVTGIKVNSNSTVANQRGIDLNIDHTGTTGEVYGILTDLDIAASHNNYGRGVYAFTHRGDDSNATYALYGSAGDGTVTYGVYGTGFSGITNYAGYFSGNVTVTGTFSNPSDKRFKENLTSIESPLDKILKLNTYSYNYKTTGEASKMNFKEGTHFGFVAQEMETVFPELVSDQVHSYDEIIKDGEEKKFKEHTFKYKGINYIEMIPVLTQAIKDQQEIIEELKARIEELEKGE